MYHLKYLFSIIVLSSLDTLCIQISANCKIVSACLCHRLHNFCGEWECWDLVKPIERYQLVVVITPADCPKSIHNRCKRKRKRSDSVLKIELCGGILCCYFAFRNFLRILKAFFCKGQSQISSIALKLKMLFKGYNYSVSNNNSSC